MDRYVALATKVLAVAKANENVGDWAAYIDAVDGHRHDFEWQDVLKSGETELVERLSAVEE